MRRIWEFQSIPLIILRLFGRCLSSQMQCVLKPDPWPQQPMLSSSMYSNSPHSNISLGSAMYKPTILRFDLLCFVFQTTPYHDNIYPYINDTSQHGCTVLLSLFPVEEHRR